MNDILIRTEGAAGRVTLNRPQALNALTPEMAVALEGALVRWRDDPAVKLVILDAAGERAFCSGGDIGGLYAEGMRGEAEAGRAFWRQEYPLNARLDEYWKPVVSLMQGFTMGGGVGVGCHGHPRIVGESAQVAMPECGIGLVPDVGGSYLLGKAPGHLGEFLGLTGFRMGPGDAIRAGFADRFVAEGDWPQLKVELEEAGDIGPLEAFARPAPEGKLAAWAEEIDAVFSAPSLHEITERLAGLGTEFGAQIGKVVARNSPLSMACALVLIRAQRAAPDLRVALEWEYRYSHRAVFESDLLEGIRAAVIDKDRTPRWMIVGEAAEAKVAEMLAPLGEAGLKFPEDMR